MENVISIIVPVYNVEPYLNRCIDSILQQTYKNLEIILVDDGSKDQCSAICDSYGALDVRIVVIHKENGGLSDARNAGLAIATGEYIAFVDSDDYIHPRMMERLLYHLNEANAEIAVCNIQYTDDRDDVEEQLQRKINEKKEILLDRKNAQLVYFNNDMKVLMTVAWNKLYKSYLFKHIKFPVSKVHEDEFVTFQLLYRAGKVTYFNEVLYYYYQKADSIMGKFNVKRFDLFEAYRVKMKFFLEQEEYLLCKRTMFLYFRMLAQYMKWSKAAGFDADELIRQQHSKLESIVQKNKKNLSFSLGERIECLIFFSSIHAYYGMWNVYKYISNRK